MRKLGWAILFFGIASFPFSLGYAAINPNTQVINQKPNQDLKLDPTYTQWFDRRLAVVESNLSDQKSDSDALSLQLAMIGIGFGALITLIVVFFALRTERTAAAAATAAANEAIAASKIEIERLVKEAQIIKLEADQVLISMKMGQGEAEAHVDKIKAALALAEKYSSSSEEKDTMSLQEGKVLREGAAAIEERSPSSWSFEDFRVLITNAMGKGDTDRAEDLSKMMQILLNNESSLVYSKNIMGNIHMRRGEYQIAADIYQKIVDEYINSNDNEIKRIAFAAARNLTQTFIHRKDYESARELSVKMIEDFGSSTDPATLKILANFYYNKAEAELCLGNASTAADDLKAMLGLWIPGENDLNDRISRNLITEANRLRKAHPHYTLTLLNDLIQNLASEPALVDAHMARSLTAIRAAEVAIEKKSSGEATA